MTLKHPYEIDSPMQGRVGVKDIFGKSGSNESMKKKFGLRCVDIALEVEKILKE